MFDKPHFIGIGQMKAGTGWLYDHLRVHPEAWVPPDKELHFFNNGFNFSPTRRVFAHLLCAPDGSGRITQQQLSPEENWRSRVRRAASEHDSLELLQYDLDFFAHALLTPDARKIEMRGKKFEGGTGIRDFEMRWYSELFVPEHLVCGEITPAYAILDAEMIQRILRNFPHTKFMLNIREPLSRAKSHLNHALVNYLVRESGMPQDDVTAMYAGKPIEEGFVPEAKIMEVIENTPNIIDKSRVSTLQESWLKLVPADKMLLTFFEDIVGNPEAVLDRVSTYLEISRDGFQRAPDENKKAAFPKVPLPQGVQDFLAAQLAEERALFEKMRAEQA